MTDRDDFPPKVKSQLALRVGYRCSNPNCNKLTIGPSPAGAGVLSVGVAAHITAAAPLGPRYDPSLTPEQRRSCDNGIWTCEICGRGIDGDESAFPVELLRKWKRAREAAALHELAGGAFADRALPSEGEPPRVLDDYLEYTTEHNLLFALHLFNPMREIITVQAIDVLILPVVEPLPWGQGPVMVETMMVGGQMIPGLRRVPFDIAPESEAIYLRYVAPSVDAVRAKAEQIVARYVWRARRNPKIQGEAAVQVLFFEREKVGWPE